MRVLGNKYILTDRPIPGAIRADDKNYVIYPRVGDVYDFTDCSTALVGGRAYKTVNYGVLGGHSVAGKKIRIFDYVAGDPCVPSIIEYEVLQ